MTTTKIFGLLGLLVGLALATDAPGNGCKPGRYGVLSVYDGKGAFGHVVRDGDRFVAIRATKDHGIPPRNLTKSRNTLWVDDKYLGYDLCGKDKNVLARVSRGQAIRDFQWEFVLGEKGTPFYGHFRVANGELKGWWVGLGSVEKEKKGEPRPRNRRGERAPLILVKEKKDAAGFDWTRPEDED